MAVYTTINDPTIYFNTVLYAGDDSTSHAITGVNFQPDWVWLKNRSAEAGHQLADVVRGKSGTNFLSLSSDTNAAEAAQGDNDGLNTLGSDGFTVGFTNSAGWNQSSRNYVSWNWKGGGSGSSNTDGSITSSVSASTVPGFSIVSYTGTGSALTCGHGLGAVPRMIIVKDRDASANWNTYHAEVGNAKTVQLNLTNAESATSSWNSTTPTSSVFSLGAVSAVNTSSNDYIAYCFAEKQGYSKIGKYVGNGNTNGTFVYLGFRPAWVMTKRSDSSSNGHWSIFDNKRDPHNVGGNTLRADSENTVTDFGTFAIDFLSNGFKLRGTNTHNDSGGTYIYMAFAESPFVNSKKVPNNAR